MVSDVEGPSVAVAGRGAGLIGALLLDQGDLSAVERFVRDHDNARVAPAGRLYSALLPASPPGPGQQLAFEVDLERCSGCKACVAACHSLNGLDDGETWRDVGLLVGGTATLPVLQHVTTACHHCLEPACLSACPVEAYEKDPVTGIVRHLDDQCFGCQYCTLACPYDVPKYHADKGIVRKCDMCDERLRAGEAPACAQACPHEAIRIRVVDREEVRARAEAGDFLPGAFDPAYTRPATRFLSVRPGDLRPADTHRLRPEYGHTPLALMLVLTQLAACGFLIELAARLAGRSHGVAGPAFPRVCLVLGLAGLTASLLHLGRPLHAYRAVLGIRHSWLSREVVAFGLFAKLAVAYLVVDALGAASPALRLALLALAAAAGAAGVASSVMVYHVVRRPFWRARMAGLKFAGTALVLGPAAALACIGLGPTRGRGDNVLPMVAAVVALATVAKLQFEARDHRDEGDGPLGETTWLLRGPLKRVVGLRRFLGVAGGLVLPALAMVGWVGNDPGATAAAAVLALASAIGGEFLERRLFFTAVSKPRMPGVSPS
jgi:Fe-S-cluster-containing dehydrogenase component/DMSO reductase anchor subunit